MAKKTKVVTSEAQVDAVANTEAPTEPSAPADAQPEQDAPKKRGRKKAADASLEDVFAGYLAGLERDGASAGTLFSYKQELVMAGEELGVTTKIADLTPERVQAYYTSDRVLKTRTGRPKAMPTILKSQRVLRLALVWGENAKLVAKAPLPEALATH